MTYLTGRVAIETGKHRLADILNEFLILNEALLAAFQHQTLGHINLERGDTARLESAV